MKKIFLSILLFSSLNIASGTNFSDFKVNLTNKGTIYPGIGPDGQNGHLLKYSRIPSMIVTNDNKLVVMYDLRWNTANDQSRIDTGIAISSDGGNTWDRKTAISFNKKHNGKLDKDRRSMDSTMIYDHINDKIYAMHGTWSKGNGQWFAKRIEHWNNNIWEATINSSSDNGYTWEYETGFSRTKNADVFKNTTIEGNKIVGFLGGVGTGIVMSDGTLVFPIQTAHENSSGSTYGKKGISFTIMYSKDQGKTWHMPKTNNLIMPNGSSLENMVFEIDGKLVATGRGNGRWAYITSDMGVSWQKYEPVDGFHESTAAPSQGSSIYVTLPNGRKVLLVSKPNGEDNVINRGDYSRANISLWALDARNKDNKYLVTVFRKGKGNPEGAGYSSLAYKNGNLFVAYEDDGDITVENLTKFIPDIEKKACEWNLPDQKQIDKNKIDKLENLNDKVKNLYKSKVDLTDDNAIVEAIVLDREVKEQKEKFENIEKSLNKALVSKKMIVNENIHNILNGKYNIREFRNLAKELKESVDIAKNTKLDFSKYEPMALEYIYTDTNISDNFDNQMYFNIRKVFNKNGLNFNLGNSINVSNFKVGAFFEIENSDIFTGISLNYNNFNGFMRYRQKNIDTYLSYSKPINLANGFSIKPNAGLLITYSPLVKLDMDANIDKRFSFVNNYNILLQKNINGVNIFAKPEIKLIYSPLVIYQSNDINNYKIINPKSSEFSFTTGIRTVINNISLGFIFEIKH